MPRKNTPVRSAIKSLSTLQKEILDTNRILTIDEADSLLVLEKTVHELRDSYVYLFHKQGTPSMLIASRLGLSNSRVSQIIKEQKELNE